MSPTALIDRYLSQADSVRRVITGLSRDELSRPLAPGKWSLQQLAIHLYDSDLVGCDRMRRIIAMERPLLIGYDENAFMARLAYDEQDAATAADAFRLNRLMFGKTLRAAPPGAFERSAVHSERGLLTLSQMLEGYVGHIDHHMRFAAGKREALGKPMAA